MVLQKFMKRCYNETNESPLRDAEDSKTPEKE